MQRRPGAAIEHHLGQRRGQAQDPRHSGAAPLAKIHFGAETRAIVSGPGGKARRVCVRVRVVAVQVARYFEEPAVAEIDLEGMPQMGQADSLHGGLLSLPTRYGQGQGTETPLPAGFLPQTVGSLPPLFNSTSLR